MKGKTEKIFSPGRKGAKHIPFCISLCVFASLRAIVFILFLPLLSFSQLSDTFSDADFTANPVWVGKTDSFTVDNGMLRSNGPQASSVIYLSTANTLIDSIEWNFLLRTDFNPSSTNQVKVYLVSDQSDLRGSLNGYYVQFGEVGTAPDSLDIFVQNGTASTKVFTGASGIMTSSTTNSVRIKIVRYPGGNWQVFADVTGGTNFTHEGNFTDNSIMATSWFGVVCKYATASRYNQYYFDDFSIAQLLADIVKPTVTNVNVLSSTAIDVIFSEPVEIISAETASNYSVDNSIGSPSSAVRDVSDLSLVHLNFSGTFQNTTNYELSISGVKDEAANVMNASAHPFSIFVAGRYDVLINELMADPAPAVGLPALEFVELYNTTAFPVSLNGWTFSDASTIVTLPNTTILPSGYLILCSVANADSFSAFGPLLGLPSLPSLNNTSDYLSLKDNFGNLIHSVNYTDDWYNSTTKSDGGWTLELINPLNPCKNTGNWTASNDSSGGTPGRRNSVYDIITIFPLSLVSVNVLSNTQIEVYFSQDLDSASVETETNYSLNNGIGSPSSAIIDSLDFTKVLLTYSAPLDSGFIYTLTANVSNCVGSSISNQNTALIAIPRSAARFDVLINEIFPDPDPQVALPAHEFVELFNRSNKAIDLKDWNLSKGLGGATLSSYLLLPDSFVIITSSASAADFSAFSNMLSVSSFPSLTNTGDQLLLKDNGGTLIHRVAYKDDWYHNNAKSDGGWTLELIDVENICNGIENWRGSVDPSGGTPGRKNSVVANNPDTILPRLLRAAVEDSNTLVLYFSELLDINSASVILNYVVSSGFGSPILATPIAPDYETARLKFANNFSVGVLYTIKVSNLTDCSGNPIGMNDSARFAIPDNPGPNDIVINEILFNPRTGGYDFVELYNRSQKIIDLSQLNLLEMDITDPFTVLEETEVASQSYLLFPEEFVVLSEDIQNIKLNYYVANPDALLQVSSLPNFQDDEGICVLQANNSVAIDSLSFSNTWHFALLDLEDGVSLERIDYNKPTQDKGNWHSAASTVGFATPTYQNSQFTETGISDDEIEIDPEVFTPDNDGEKDFTYVYYKFSEPGYMMNAKVYDAKGREVRELVRSELLGSEGRFQWDGIDDDNQKARVGIYIMYIELFNLHGQMKKFKKLVVLGAKLN